MTPRTRSSLSGTRLGEGVLNASQAEFNLLEAALLEARLRAESFDKPVLAYFIDMAIEELRTIYAGRSRNATPVNCRKSSKDVPFVNSPAKVALRAR
jgi:hypothetical protein